MSYSNGVTVKNLKAVQLLWINKQCSIISSVIYSYSFGKISIKSKLWNQQVLPEDFTDTNWKIKAVHKLLRNVETINLYFRYYKLFFFNDVIWATFLTILFVSIEAAIWFVVPTKRQRKLAQRTALVFIVTITRVHNRISRYISPQEYNCACNASRYLRYATNRRSQRGTFCYVTKWSRRMNVKSVAAHCCW